MVQGYVIVLQRNPHPSPRSSRGQEPHPPLRDARGRVGEGATIGNDNSFVVQSANS